MPPIPEVPSRFKFHLQFRIEDRIWTTMYEIFQFDECNGPSSAPFLVESGYPHQGYNQLKDISVWVTNQSKQGNIKLSFFSKKDWEKSASH